MNIIRQKTTQIILLPHNQIPFISLINRKYADALLAKYRFTSGAPIQDPNGVVVAVGFSMGLFVNEGKKEVPVIQFVVEDRKILLQVEGNSDDASALFGEAKEFLTEITEPRENDFLNPVVIANESELIVHLDFGVDRLFSHQLYDFVQTDVVARASGQFQQSPETSIDLIRINFQINYRPMDNSLSERTIALAKKEFSLETAIGYPFTERVYYSRAPVSTVDHVQLLEKIEMAFA